MTISPVTSTDSSRRKRRKKSRLALSLNSTDPRQITTNETNNNKWRTSSEQQKYSSKLLQTLRHMRKTSTSASSKSDHLVIREAADRALAITAKGKSRWSRSILKNRMKFKFLKVVKKSKVMDVLMKTGRTRRTVYSRKMNVAEVRKKGLVLGKLVPGCRKQTLAVVLEEAHDYISALEMQVRVMNELAQLLSVAAGAVVPPPRPEP